MKKLLTLVCALVALSSVSFAQEYKVGDVITINGVEGIVYKAPADDQPGMAWSVYKTTKTEKNGDETIICVNNNWKAANEWCANLGPEWKMPTNEELLEIYKLKSGNVDAEDEQIAKTFKKVCEDKGIKWGLYWSCGVDGESPRQVVNMYSGKVLGIEDPAENKDDEKAYCFVCAIATF